MRGASLLDLVRVSRAGDAQADKGRAHLQGLAAVEPVFADKPGGELQEQRRVHTCERAVAVYVAARLVRERADQPGLQLQHQARVHAVRHAVHVHVAADPRRYRRVRRHRY